MNAHTPGPWIVEESRNGKRGPVSLLMVVAEAGGMPGLIVNQGAPEPRDYANGRLIAAAPDLLAATRKALGVLHGDDMSKQALIDAMTACVAAIKKAEGK